MINLQKRYRNSYPGENIITMRVQKNQVWHNTTEWIPNSVINNHVSKNAVAIGNGISRAEFDLNYLKDHKSGLLGANSLQTYGTQDLYKTFTPDFLVITGLPMAEEVAMSGYTTGHIVYTGAKEMLSYPGKFYLTPYDPGYNAGSEAVYLACFDGHKRVYMLGFDAADFGGYENNVYTDTDMHWPWPDFNGDTTSGAGNFAELALKHIMDIYNDVDFVRVMPSQYASVPAIWRYVTNFRQIDFRQFVIEADI